MYNTSKQSKSKSRDNNGASWYRQVAGAALAAGAGVLSATPDAEAQITVYTANISTTVPPSTDAIFFDYLTGVASRNENQEGFNPQFAVGHWGDIDAALAIQEVNEDGIPNQLMAKPIQGMYGVYFWPYKSPAGAVIGPTRSFQTVEAYDFPQQKLQTLAQKGFEDSVGYWRFDVGSGGTEGYLGLRFSTDNGANYRYGWAEVQITEGLNFDNFTLKRFAYNTELNQPIQAAQINNGDYNNNGTVDAADYVVWRKQAGTTGAGLAADGISDGVVNDADYQLWRTHFGRVGAGSGVSATAVPEPSASLLVLGAAGVGLYRARRKQNEKDSASPKS